MTRRPRALLALTLLLCLAAPTSVAAAEPPGSPAALVVAQRDGGGAVRAGKNLCEIGRSWGGALLLGVAGLMGLAALARRNLAEGVTLLGIVLLVGGFIFADDAVKGFVEALWSAVAGR